MTKCIGLPLSRSIFSGSKWILDKLENVGAKPDNIFVSQADGDSLIGDGIRSGAFLFIDAAAPVVDGQIYVVRVPDGICAKHYHQEGDTVKLKPSNPDYQDLVYRAEEVEIIGCIVYSMPFKV